MNYKVIKSRIRKNIELRAGDGEIIIYAPDCVSDFTIQNIYEKYKNKINIVKRRDDILYYLGREYNIVIEKTKLIKKAIYEIIDNNFYIFLPYNVENYDIKELTKKWQISQAHIIIEQRIKHFLSIYKFNFDININTITIRNQKTKWGSCTFFNNLNFNYRIIEKRIEIVDYLIIHELSHTIEKNHSKIFWELVGNIIPDYKILRKELNNIDK